MPDETTTHRNTLHVNVGTMKHALQYWLDRDYLNPENTVQVLGVTHNDGDDTYDITYEVDLPS